MFHPTTNETGGTNADGRPGPLYDTLVGDLSPLNQTGLLQNMVLAQTGNQTLPVTYPDSDVGSTLLGFDPTAGESLDYAFFEPGDGTMEVWTGVSPV